MVSPQASAADWSRALTTGVETLRKNEMIVLTLPDAGASGSLGPNDISRLLEAWRSVMKPIVLPAYCSSADASLPAVPAGSRPPIARVVFGDPLSDQCTLDEARLAISQLAHVLP
jgi:hypothetical protein